MSDRAGGRNARRAVLRWSWRLFRRQWRQQVLLLALVSVTVTAAVAFAAIIVNAADPVGAQFGAGGALTRATIADPADVARIVAAAERRFGTIQPIRHLAVAVPGSIRALDVRAQDPSGALGKPMLRLVGGRYPTRSDEVALTDGAGDLLDAATGGTVDLAGARRRVVGRVENPGDLHDEFALLAPSDDAPADSLVILLTDARRGGRERPPGAADEGGEREASIPFAVTSTDDAKAAVRALVIAASTAAMALVALVASAGFLVVVHRRQRQLGLLAALGAPERIQRLVLVANGLYVGVIAAVIGAVAGIGIWLVVAPAVEVAAAHRIGRTDLPWGLIGACLLLAVLSSTAAAWWPARTASRQPIMAALARRPVRRAPVHRPAAAALALVVGGYVAIVQAYPAGKPARPVLLIGGLVALIAGTVLVAPLAIRAVGRAATTLPLAPRLALRDLARFQSRAAAAVAAITLGLGLCVAVAIAAQAAVAGPEEGNLSDHQLVLRAPGDGAFGPSVDPSETARRRLDAAAESVGRALGTDVVRVALDVPSNPGGEGPDGPVPVGVAEPISHGYRFADEAYVATPTLLALLDVDPTTIGTDVDLLTARDGDVVLLDPSTRPVDGDGDRTRVQRIDVPRYDDAPTSLVTSGALERHGWAGVRTGWLFTSTHALDHDRLAAARGAAAAAGLVVESRSAQDDLAALRLASTAVGALLALAIVAMTVGLIRSENGADLRTLTAAGAAPGTRRSVTASTAGILSSIGGLLGCAGAYLAVAASYHADLDRLRTPPLGPLAAVIVGVPILAAAGGWLLAGREPSTFARVLAE